jgi:mono/diheme cytochrome c family protein
MNHKSLVLLGAAVGLGMVASLLASARAAEPGAPKPAAAAAPKAAAAAAPKSAPAASPAQIKRGEYLVTIASCHDCHTPMKMTPNGPAPDFSRALSGHPPDAPEPAGSAGKTDLMLSGSDLTSFRMPYGMLYSRNLTPDKSGIGEWTEAQFIKTLRTGRHQGEGRPLMPPMPWPNAAAMTDEDLKAVFAYLKSIKPIQNNVPEPKVPPAAIDQFAKTNQALVAEMSGKPAK